MKIRFAMMPLLALFAAHCTGGQGTNSNPTLTTPPPDVATVSEQDVAAPPIEQDAAPEPTSSPDVTEPDVMVVAPATDAGTSVDAARADSGRTSTTRPATNTTRPTTATGTTPTTGSSDAALADARAVFDRSCGRCHPGGNNRVGPRLTGRNDSEAHTRQVVRNGDGTMRPIPASRLSDGDLAKVIVFLRSIRAVR